MVKVFYYHDRYQLFFWRDCPGGGSLYRKTVVGEPFTMIDFHKVNSLSFCLQKSSVADDLQELLWTLIQSVN